MWQPQDYFQNLGQVARKIQKFIFHVLICIDNTENDYKESSKEKKGKLKQSYQC